MGQLIARLQRLDDRLGLSPESRFKRWDRRGGPSAWRRQLLRRWWLQGVLFAVLIGAYLAWSGRSIVVAVVWAVAAGLLMTNAARVNYQRYVAWQQDDARSPGSSPDSE